MQHRVLDGFNGGREIYAAVTMFGIETNDRGLREERGDASVRGVSRENEIIDAGQSIPLKTANGFNRAEDGFPDARGVELHQRAVSLLHLANEILDGHAARIVTKPAGNQRFFKKGALAKRLPAAPDSAQLIAPHLRFHLPCPGVDPAGQAAYVLQAMAEEMAGRVQPMLPLMIDDHNWLRV